MVLDFRVGRIKRKNRILACCGDIRKGTSCKNSQKNPVQTDCIYVIRPPNPPPPPQKKKKTKKTHTHIYLQFSEFSLKILLLIYINLYHTDIQYLTLTTLINWGKKSSAKIQGKLHLSLSNIRTDKSTAEIRGTPNLPLNAVYYEIGV